MTTQVLNTNGFDCYNPRPIKICEHVFSNANRDWKHTSESLTMMTNMHHYTPMNWAHSPSRTIIWLFCPPHLQRIYKQLYRLHWKPLINQDNQHVHFILKSAVHPLGLHNKSLAYRPALGFLVEIHHNSVLLNHQTSKPPDCEHFLSCILKRCHFQTFGKCIVCFQFVI